MEGRRRTDVDKLDRRNFSLHPAKGRIQLLALRKLPQAREHGGHRVLERGARPLVGRREPLVELGGRRDALLGGEPRAAEHELRRVLERAPTRVIKGDVVHEPAVDRHVCLFEVGDVVRPGRGDRLQLFGCRQAHA